MNKQNSKNNSPNSQHVDDTFFKNPNRWLIGYEDDWVFHYVFGQNTKESKDALIAFLNVILCKEKNPITSIEILNPINYRTYPADKETTLDIKARTSQNELFDIELQNGNLKHYPNRCVQYGGKLVNLSLEKGEDYDKMGKSIVISIVTGTLFPNIPGIHTTFHLWEDSCRHLLSDRLEMHFIELGKVQTDKPMEAMNNVEQLAAYLKLAGEEKSANYLKTLIEDGGEAIQMAEKVFQRASEDFYARVRQMEIEMREHDLATKRLLEEEERAERLQEAENNGIEIGMNKGLKKGIEQGLKQGLERGLEQGIQQGLEQGLEQGIQQGLVQSIRVLILDNRSEGISEEKILRKLVTIFNLNENDALHYMNQYK